MTTRGSVVKKGRHPFSLLFLKTMICTACTTEVIHMFAMRRAVTLSIGIKPKLGMVESDSSSQNNIILKTCENAFTPFMDTKPGVSSSQKYKASMEIEGGQKGLHLYSSGDGTTFSRVGGDPAIPWTIPNHFDSQNVLFWSEVESKYVMYARIMVRSDGELIDTDEYLSIVAQRPEV